MGVEMSVYGCRNVGLWVYKCRFIKNKYKYLLYKVFSGIIKKK